MTRLNLKFEKLLPRVAIRTKLAIAFALLAIVPLALVATLATWMTVTNLRATAKVTLEHDLEAAAIGAEGALAQADADVHHLALMLLGPTLGEANAIPWDSVARSVSDFLGRAPGLSQVKLISADGAVLLVARASGAGPAGEMEGLYYSLLARAAKPGEHLVLPVELRGGQPGAGGHATRIAAVAILMPMWDARGAFRGVVVGEAHAADIFLSLEGGSPQLVGTTGLVDLDGLYLYHSERKRDWAGLVAERSELDLRSEFEPAESEAILSGKVGTLTSAAGRIVSFFPLRLGASSIRSQILYRAVPLAVIDAPVRRFLLFAVLAGLIVTFLVIALAFRTAEHFTRPIYQLRQGVAGLARGEAPSPLQVATNDELQDLAADFSEMAASLSEYRRNLEDLVAERTRALRETHAELADILAYAADAIIGLDPEGRVRVWNRGAEALFGHGAAEALGQDADALLLPRDPSTTREAAFIRRELAEHGAVVNLRTRRVAKNGEVIPVSLTQTQISGYGAKGKGPVGSSLIIRDSRMQAKLEEQMRRSEHLAVVSVLAAGLAHEINNPLAVIVNRVDCMEREAVARCPGCFLEKDLRVLREHSARLGDVTRNLLRFARDDGGETGPVELGQVGPRIAGLLERTFAMRNVHLEILPAGDLPPVWGNEKAIETVCLNLLLNAVEATPSGGSVTVSARRSASGEGVELEVRDTGVGVPPDVRERIFEPFFTTKGTKGGTGLGLPVCRSIVERHGGRIWVETEEGRGSRFVVLFPLRSAEPA